MKRSITFVAALATLAAYPVRADVCVDFHAAVAIERAANEAADSHFRDHPPSVSDSDLEGRAKLKVQESLIRASNVADEAVRKAERSVRESIEDEGVAGIIDSIVEIRRAYSDAWRAVDASRRSSIRSLRWQLVPIGATAREAHHEALSMTCRLGLASTQ